MMMTHGELKPSTSSTAHDKKAKLDISMTWHDGGAWKATMGRSDAAAIDAKAKLVLLKNF